MKAVDLLNPLNQTKNLVISPLIDKIMCGFFFYKNGGEIDDYDKMKFNYDRTVENYPQLYPEMTLEEKMVQIPSKKGKTKEFVKNLFRASKTKDKDALKKVVELHTCEIKKMNSNKYVVALLGDQEIFEGKIRSFSEMAQKNDVNILTFNYRGRGESTGRVKNGQKIVKDSILQVKNLIAKGVPVENIGIYGKCFGGAVATKVAEQLHKEGLPVQLFADRTFKSLADVYIGMKFNEETKKTLEEKGGFSHKMYNVLEKVVPIFVKLGIGLSRWEINVDEAYKKIPEEYKMYVNIQSPKEFKENKVLEDGLIQNHASLHEGLKKERKERKALIKQGLAEIKVQKKRILKIFDAEEVLKAEEILNKKEQELLTELDKIKEKKMYGFENVDKVTVREIYKRNPKIHMIERLREALMVNNYLYEAIVKLEDSNEPNLTEQMREQSRENIKRALIDIGSRVAKRDITNNGEIKLPEDLKGYIVKSMLIIDEQLESLLKDVTKKTELNMEQKMTLPVEYKKLTNQLPHFVDLDKLTSRASTRNITAEQLFNEWTQKIQNKDLNKDLSIDERKDILISREVSKNKEPISDKEKDADNVVALKELQASDVFNKKNMEYSLRNARDYALLYGSMVGSAALTAASVAQGVAPAATVAGYVSVGIMGVGTTAGLAHHALNLSNAREECENLKEVKKEDLSKLPLKERKKLKERLEEFKKSNETSIKEEKSNVVIDTDSKKTKAEISKNRSLNKEKVKNDIAKKMLKPKKNVKSLEI